MKSMSTRVLGCLAILLMVALISLGQPYPAAGAKEAPAVGHARLVFDPQVTEADQELIAEAVRLAEDFFSIRFAVPLGADVTVTTLPIPAPNDQELVAATVGQSMVIYSQSLGWAEVPPAERVRTVIHEYTHVYQYSKLSENQLASAAWFEEGVAEYLSMLALDELGLMNRAAMEGYFGAILESTQPPPLQTLEGYSALQSQSAEVYPLAYFGVAQLLQDLPLSAIDDYYTYLERGMPFAQAFELAYGITPETFYADFATFLATELPTVWFYPDELSIWDGTDQPSSVSAEEAPLFVIPGQQALVVAGATPGSSCALDLTTGDVVVVIDDRETFSNGIGRAFWLLTIPTDIPSGPGVFILTCGGEPMSIPVLVSQASV